MTKTKHVYALGVDPGRTTGIAGLHWRVTCGKALLAVDPDLVQCTPLVAPQLLASLLDDYPPGTTVVAIEQYVIRHRAGRTTSAATSALTAQLVGACTRTAQAAGLDVVQYSAAQVKPWATDERLDAAGLLDRTKGMRHARDAVRHALYAGCRIGMPDPLRKGEK